MTINPRVLAGLNTDETGIYRAALAVCRKYPRADQNDWVAAILLHLFESYLRIAVTMERDGDLSVAGRTESFVRAHQEAPLLPPYLMDIAATAMRYLEVEDSCRLIAFAEESAHFRKRGASLRESQALLDALAKEFQRGCGGAVAPREAARRRTSEFEAQRVWETSLGASRTARGRQATAASRDGRLIFLTLGDPRQEFLTDEPVSHPEAIVFAQGNRQGGSFSPYGVGRGSWRLTIHFSVFNNTANSCVVYDLHAKVYNRQKDAKVLATVSHSMSVELLKDNSILGRHAAVNLDPGDSLGVSVALEASVFESPKTTVVFGLLVDFYAIENGAAVTRTLPSDALYVFQHELSMGPGCHFVSRTVDQIRSRMKAEAGNADVQEACRSLLKCFDQHDHNAVSASGVPSIDDTHVPLFGNQKSQAADLALRGIESSENGRLEEALDRCHEALAIFREIGEQKFECMTLDAIAGIYYRAAAFQRALDYAEMELDLARKIGNRLHESAALTMAGSAQNSLGKSNVAIGLHAQALAIARAERDRPLEALVLYNKCLAQYAVGSREGAISTACAALEIFEGIDDPRSAEVRQRLDEWEGHRPPR